RTGERRMDITKRSGRAAADQLQRHITFARRNRSAHEQALFDLLATATLHGSDQPRFAAILSQGDARRSGILGKAPAPAATRPPRAEPVQRPAPAQSTEGNIR